VQRACKACPFGDGVFDPLGRYTVQVSHEIRVAYARLDGREHIIECHCGHTFTGTGETARMDATALYREHESAH